MRIKVTCRPPDPGIAPCRCSAIHLRYIALQAEAESINQRLQSYQQERNALAFRGGNGSAPGRLFAGARATTLAQRVRDAALTRSQYEAMLAKQQAAKLDQRMEKSAKGVAYKVAEIGPDRPGAPSSPQRNRIILMGLVAGLGLGLIAVLIVEQMDTTFDSIEEFQGFTNLPVLCGRSHDTQARGQVLWWAPASSLKL